MTIQTIRQKQIMFLLVVALLLVACNPSAGGETVVPATNTATAPATAEPTATATVEAAAPAELTETMLDNLAYQGIYSETIQLADGKYEGEPFMEGNVLRPTVNRLPLTAFGDLNGDGVNDAAVLLGEQSGGTGRFIYLAAVINQAGNPENVSTIFLGDRVSPQTVAITEGQIVMEIVTHADSDPLCCPSLMIRSIYALQGQLTLISSESLQE